MVYFLGADSLLDELWTNYGKMFRVVWKEWVGETQEEIGGRTWDERGIIYAHFNAPSHSHFIFTIPVLLVLLWNMNINVFLW